ncbi:DUF6882 domain-containing protein [Undibacterium sp.]|uniref:DUF6882 domain-containing protein n=1 Tax=Undibacterium sp. TaxID=1914977 RepID=UPI00273187C1|nr:DUF6882 domain-containing protein [Undibacterium sp.]MDP1977416.1 hypothetical protein [Undibacterium sp.]
MSMDEEFDELTCAQHGKVHTTYVCEHLISDPVQKWHSDYPDAENHWPDAWCEVCNAHYQAEGEWNEHNEDLVPIKLLCHVCYEEMRSASLARITGADYDAWDNFVDACFKELQDKSGLLNQEFSLGSHQRYDWDQETGELVFSNDGVPAVIAKIDFIGSYSSKTNTWLWSWANFHLLEGMRIRVAAVRDYGESHDYPWLTTSKWEAEEGDAWDMAAVAAHVLQAKGVYRSPREGGAGFLLIREISRA